MHPPKGKKNHPAQLPAGKEGRGEGKDKKGDESGEGEIIANTLAVCSYYKWELEKTTCLGETDKPRRGSAVNEEDREAVESQRQIVGEESGDRGVQRGERGSQSERTLFPGEPRSAKWIPTHHLKSSLRCD